MTKKALPKKLYVKLWLSGHPYAAVTPEGVAGFNENLVVGVYALVGRIRVSNITSVEKWQSWPRKGAKR